MSTDSFLLRTVRKEKEFDALAAKIYGGTRKADEVTEALEWTLSRSPHTYSVVAAKHTEIVVYAIRVGDDLPSWPNAIVFYTIDKDYVTLLRIEVSDPDDL